MIWVIVVDKGRSLGVMSSFFEGSVRSSVVVSSASGGVVRSSILVVGGVSCVSMGNKYKYVFGGLTFRMS